MLAFVRASIESVSALEVLLLLKRDRGKQWQIGELVKELRSSDLAVERALASLQLRQLVAWHEGERIRYAPGTPDLDGRVEAIEKLYVIKPLTVIRTIAEAPTEKLRVFARSFRLRD